jgi:hypothetical protein
VTVWAVVFGVTGGGEVVVKESKRGVLALSQDSTRRVIGGGVVRNVNGIRRDQSVNNNRVVLGKDDFFK